MMRDLVHRFYQPEHALDQPGVWLMCVVIVGLLAAACVSIGVLGVAGKLAPALKTELWKRTFAWAVMVPLVIGPILLSPGAAIVMVLVLSLLCYREYARATGLFRERGMSVTVVVSIIATGFACLDHWYGLFAALPALAVIATVASAILADRPKGFVQRVGLSVLAVVLFATCLGHAGYLANDGRYRGVMMLLMMAVGLNDVFAFCVGKTIGGPKLSPLTSPGKTISGALGAVVLTTALVYVLSGMVFAGTRMSEPMLRIGLGVALSVSGILGDLTISSIKRDVGVKDMGSVIPGHGGVLDRCNSLLLAAPVMFHYVGYFAGIGLEQRTRLISGGW
jgi:phosphatidate cytidylyltransferase